MIKKSRNGEKDGVLKKWAVLLIAVMILVSGFSLQVQAGSQDFNLVNMTRVDIYELYIAPYNSNDWEEEILGGDILRNGENINIHINGRYETYWDIMIKDWMGNSIYWRGLNLRRISRIILYKNGNQVWADWE
jgi:hypothetical protein